MNVRLAAQLQEGRAHILVVDDDPQISAGLADILRDAGYAVTTAGLGEQAVASFRTDVFSAMITDYSLPDTNGVALARDAHSLDPFLEIILLTGHDHVDLEGKSLALFTAFLRKPSDSSMILTLLEEIVTRQCERLKVAYGAARVADPLSAGAGPVPDPAPISVAAPAELPVPEILSPPDRPRESRWDWRREMSESPLALRMTAVLLMGFAVGWWSRGGPWTPSEPEAVPAAVPIVTVAAAPEAPLPPDMAVALAAPPPDTARRPERGSPLEARLNDDAPLQRIKAAKALLKRKPTHAKAIAALAALAQDPDPQQRVEAIQALSAAGAAGPLAEITLREALKDPAPPVAYAAVQALQRLMGPATPTVTGPVSVESPLAPPDPASLALAPVISEPPADPAEAASPAEPASPSPENQ